LRKLKTERAFGKHSTSPRVLSITQPTEVGTVYSLEELRILSKLCKEENVLLHIDGSRLYNAAIYLQSNLGDIVNAVRPDIVSLGGTKNGLLGAEALLIFNESLQAGSDHLQKQTLQLLSKMRYASAQYIPFFKMIYGKYLQRKRIIKLAKLPPRSSPYPNFR
jgi:threonine aldolase